MKRCWMLLVCLGIAGCAAESIDTSETSQAVYKGPRVPTPTVYFYKGGSLPVVGASHVWVLSKSPLDGNEDLAVDVDTSNGTIAMALRVQPQDLAQFNFQLGKTGAGYLRPVVGAPPPPPPDVWPTYFVAAAYRALDLPQLAIDDAWAAPK